MTYVKSTTEDHPFHHTSVIWFKGGDPATSDPSFAGFEVGDEVHIRQWLEEDADGETSYYVVLLEDSEPDDGSGPAWNVSWFTDCQSKVRRNTNPTTVQEDSMTENTSNRVEIDFSGSSRATARSYAADLQSRVNKPETNAILNAIEHGEPVEAFAAAEALLDTMRHVSTRFGQSMARRRAGEKVAHLGYIVHGVLGNVADDLPVYQQGDRSRAVEDAKVALVEAREEVEALTAAYNRRGREVEQVRRDAEEKVTRLIGSANDEIDKVKAERDSLAAKLRAVEVERDAAAMTISHVVGRLDDEGKASILGYWEGALDALNPQG